MERLGEQQAVVLCSHFPFRIRARRQLPSSFRPHPLRVKGKGHWQTIIATCHANTYATRRQANPIGVAMGYKLGELSNSLIIVMGTCPVTGGIYVYRDGQAN